MPTLRQRQKDKELWDLRTIPRTTTLAGAPPGGLPPPRTQRARRRWWFAAGAIALVIGAAIVAAGLLLWPKTSVPTPPLAVTTLRATRPAIGNVVLTWRVNPNGTRPERFRVARNGTPLASVGPKIVRYTDPNAAPGKTYVYSVTALTIEGTSPPQNVRVQVPMPPLAAARLSGRFKVTVLLTAEDGYTELEVGDRLTETWYFDPQCGSGACATRVANYEVGGLTVPLASWTIQLKRDGAHYAGTTKANISTCIGLPVEDTIAVTLQVSRAKMVNGEWSATAWTGTYKDTAPYFKVGLQYCSASSYTATVRGS